MNKYPVEMRFSMTQEMFEQLKEEATARGTSVKTLMTRFIKQSLSPSHTGEQTDAIHADSARPSKD